jgi:hypothetical protein
LIQFDTELIQAPRRYDEQCTKLNTKLIMLDGLFGDLRRFVTCLFPCFAKKAVQKVVLPYCSFTSHKLIVDNALEMIRQGQDYQMAVTRLQVFQNRLTLASLLVTPGS